MKHFNLLAIGILSLLLVGCSYNANEGNISGIIANGI